MSRIVFVVPQLNSLGGVSLHYKGLQRFWTEEVRYCEMKSFQNRGIIHRAWITLCNLLSFLKIIVVWSPTHIVLNTSLKPGFYSQYYHWRIARLFRLKIGLFIHGWDTERENDFLDRVKCQRFLNGVDGIFVLSSEFKKAVEERRISTPIYLVTTKVDNELLKDFVFESKEFLNSRFLFVARLIRQKGIFEALDTFRIIQKHYPNVTFDIVGDGADREDVERYIEERHITNASVRGALSGSRLAEAYSNADYFFLLTFWGEGMPGSLLEAISFGLIPIVRGMGGIPEIFKDGEMGILSNESAPEYFAQRLLEIMKEPEKAKAISHANYIMGQKRFLASVVAKRIESIVAGL